MANAKQGQTHAHHGVAATDIMTTSLETNGERPARNLRSQINSAQQVRRSDLEDPQWA
jgi:hypothetical protein